MRLTLTAVALSVMLVGAEPISAIDLDAGGRFRLFGDLRLRLESDRDSEGANGSKREDRDRARIRARLGLEYDASSIFQLGLRLRTGSVDSQQSPHITVHDFDDNPRGDEDILLDKYFVSAHSGRFRGWLGRNSLPFWKQNELFWDDDVTPAGLALRWDPELASGAGLQLRTGIFKLLDGGIDLHGEMAAGQLVFTRDSGEVSWTAAGGLFALQGETGARHLRRGNGARDYTLWVGNLQAKAPVAGSDLTIGLDLMVNSESYDRADPDPFTAANHDQTDGFVVSVRWGRLVAAGDWLVGYWYARIETFAVNASHAQDDWIRWGSATQTDASDMKGHELRYAYALRQDLNVLARLYLVEAITSRQDGNRFRADLNWRF